MASDATTRSPLSAVLPDYELFGELGRGAMGVVLAGRHRTLGRDVAIKELPPAFAADEAVRQRFVNEARTLASLSHPHVVQIYDFVDRDGHLALVMERLPGGTVWHRFTADGFSAPDACALILATASGLDHAHRHGVLHRDVKPDNLLFAADGSLKVTDFGIAKVMGGERTLATVEGAVLGTPAYMAPEQAEGQVVGPAADVYACGTMLFELMSGRLPFALATTPLATLVARIRDEAPHLSTVAAQVPDAVAAVVDTALARDPADRFPTVEDLAVALGQAAAGAWGPNWLAATNITVVGSDAITWAARTARPGGGGTLGPGASAPMVRRPARETVIDLRDRQPAADLTDLRPDDLVDVAVWRSPRRVTTGRVVAALAALLLAGATLAAASGMLTADVPAGAGAGTGPAAVVDLSQPTVTLPLAGPGSDAVWRFGVLGLPLGEVAAPLVEGTVTFEPGYLRWTVAGTVDAVVTVDGVPRPNSPSQVRVINPWWLTAPHLAIVMAVLFGLAWASAHGKGLRASRSRLPVGPLLGLATAGAALGTAAAGYGWLVAGVPLTPAGLAACAGLGAGAGVSAGWASRTPVGGPTRRRTGPVPPSR